MIISYHNRKKIHRFIIDYYVKNNRELRRLFSEQENIVRDIIHDIANVFPGNHDTKLFKYTDFSFVNPLNGKITPFRGSELKIDLWPARNSEYYETAEVPKTAHYSKIHLNFFELYSTRIQFFIDKLNEIEQQYTELNSNLSRILGKCKTDDIIIRTFPFAADFISKLPESKSDLTSYEQELILKCFS